MDDYGMEQQLERRKKTRAIKKQSDAVPAFLSKTYEILENPQYDEVISWNEEGNAFIVKKVNEFTETILPKFFKHSNFASFVRQQLNMYDFHKTRNDNNENEFKHKMFLRGCKSLLPQIKRKSGDISTPVTHQQLAVKLPMDRPFTEFNELVTEMAVLANKQSELEKLIKILIKQNEKFQKDNKYLWNELIKNKQKNESQQERLLLWFIQSLTQPKAPARKPTKPNRDLLMIRSDDPVSKEQSNQVQESLIHKLLNNNSQNSDADPFIEQTLEGLSKRHLIQGLFQAFNFQRSNKKTIKNLLLNRQFTDDDDSSGVSDSEPNYPSKKMKVEKLELGEIETPQQQNQVMLYQESKNSNYNKYFPQYPPVTNNHHGTSTRKPQEKVEKVEQQYDFPVHYSPPQQEQQQQYLLQEYPRQEDYIVDFLQRKDSLSHMFAGDQINDQW